MNSTEMRELIQKCYERDKDHFDLEGMIQRYRGGAGNPLIDFGADLLRSVGPLIYEHGFFDGAQSGLEIAADINRSIRK